MFVRNRKVFVSAIIVLTLIAGFVVLSKIDSARAGLEKTWITIDFKELQKMQSAAIEEKRPLDVETVRVENDIAIVRASERQMAQISDYAHTIFKKCGGFIAHKDETDALQIIENFSRPTENFVAVDYTINNGTVVQDLASEMSASNIANTINHLSTNYTNRYYNAQSGLNSATWIKNHWTTLANGRSDVTVEFFNHPTWVQPSVILTIQGASLPSEVVVLGAHQDSIRSGCSSSGTCLTAVAPGADDDASGIAALTEMIRVAMTKKYSPSRTVKFMAYAAEEVGLRGSAEIAQNYLTNGVNVVGVLQLDMTNYKSPSADVAIITDRTNAAQNQFIRDLISTYQPSLTVVDTACGYGCSDHASWHARNFPASFPFEAPFDSDNPYIHTANDTLPNSDSTGTHALKFSKLAAAFTAELAKGSFVTQAQIPREKFADFDGDGRTDISVFRPSDGTWYLQKSTDGFAAVHFGFSTDKLVPADFDGDGKTDIAVYRDGFWYLMQSRQNTFVSMQFGSPTDKPMPKDFDGDGKADYAVYRGGNWYVWKSLDAKLAAMHFGLPDDIPAASDYDGDGLADYAVYRPSNGTWYLMRSSDGFASRQFGTATDKPAPADYDGDGKTDIAVYRNGIWYMQRSLAGFYAVQFGTATDVPAVGDYDGDGSAEPSVYRNGNWYLMQTANGFRSEFFGMSSDNPLPGSFLP